MPTLLPDLLLSLLFLFNISLASLVHTQHSLSVQTPGPVSLVHMQHSLSVQSSYSAVYPPPHTLLLLAAVLVFGAGLEMSLLVPPADADSD